MKLFLATALFLGAPAVARDFTPAEQGEIIRATAELVERRYVDPERGQAIAAELRRAATRRKVVADGEALAREMTGHLPKIAAQRHLELNYSAEPIADAGGEAAFAEGEMEKWYGPHINHGVERIERLDDNVMLLDLRVFPPAAMGGDVFAAAMTVVAQADALIID